MGSRLSLVARDDDRTDSEDSPTFDAAGAFLRAIAPQEAREIEVMAGAAPCHTYRVPWADVAYLFAPRPTVDLQSDADDLAVETPIHLTPVHIARRIAADDRDSRSGDEHARRCRGGVDGKACPRCGKRTSPLERAA
jgi:hypothetical protein